VTIDGHYWLEIRLSPQKKEGTKKANLQKTLSKKLKRILMNADIQVTEEIVNDIASSGQNKDNNN